MCTCSSAKIDRGQGRGAGVHEGARAADEGLVRAGPPGQRRQLSGACWAMPCTESSQWITVSRRGCSAASALSARRKITERSSRLA